MCKRESNRAARRCRIYPNRTSHPRRVLPLSLSYRRRREDECYRGAWHCSEDHTNRIADLGPQYRTENSGGLPLCRPWFKAGKGFVGIFAIQRLAIDTPNAMRAALDKDFRVA